ncbi:phage tail protein [Nodularia spumigena CENA596]|jgi:hypothetical protein|uniref:Phage tail protein n=1 Tax=Nodularia spumigena CENA596 TaxID=1819295 RepID=A0A166K4Z2_NODSP|nr:hypothetical protein N9414_00535 [Nodularia spumigena CCY9414]KZL50576.1 phage tail protein [Nodularia spumigena CENA596]
MEAKKLKIASYWLYFNPLTCTNLGKSMALVNKHWVLYKIFESITSLLGNILILENLSIKIQLHRVEGKS